ncbi:MAG: putative maltokinase [Nitrospiraceae bacterium]|nr:putative maltokinase [Nitrospiraceae bacterium]
MSNWVDHLRAAVGQNDRRIAEYLTAQRWFGAKGRTINGVSMSDYAVLSEIPQPAVLAIFDIEYADNAHDHYLLPLVIRFEHGIDASHEPTIVTFQHQSETAAALDATTDAAACFAILEGIRQEHTWQGTGGRFTCVQISSDESIESLPLRHVKRVATEQSNTSLIYDSQAILKLIRKLERGVNPDCEIMEFLTANTSYRHVPALLGHIRYETEPRTAEEPAWSATVAVLQSFVPNEGDGWTMTLRHLEGLLSDSRSHEDANTPSQAVVHIRTYSGNFLSRMRCLGEITAGLHVALASDTADAAFRPEPMTQGDVERWQTALRGEIHTVLQHVRAMSDKVLEPLSLSRETLGGLEAACLDKTADASLLTTHRVMKIRIHGDYHLGQVLDTNPGFTILDFEGEPARTLEERRTKTCPLKDVAGMLRSFNYAGHVALRQSKSSSALDRRLLEAWEQETVEAFLSSYYAVAKPGDVAFLPDSPYAAARLLALFQLEKAIYELRYEINNRPDWIEIPIQGLRRLIGQ